MLAILNMKLHKSLFAFVLENEQLAVSAEAHYQLVPADSVTQADLVVRFLY